MVYNLGGISEPLSHPGLPGSTSRVSENAEGFGAGNGRAARCRREGPVEDGSGEARPAKQPERREETSSVDEAQTDETGCDVWLDRG